MRSPHTRQFVSALDLGQAQDYTALVTVQWYDRDKPEVGGEYLRQFDVLHLHRWHLGTPYPRIVSDVKATFAGTPLAGTILVVDATGVGAAVVDMFRESHVAADLRPYSITAGLKPGDGTVPKKDLVGAVQAAIGDRRLRFAVGLEFTETLTKELEAFRHKVTADRNDTFAAWRERDHDDLVLALALAVWVATNEGPYLEDPYGTRNLPPAPDRAPWE